MQTPVVHCSSLHVSINSACCFHIHITLASEQKDMLTVDGLD